MERPWGEADQGAHSTGRMCENCYIAGGTTGPPLGISPHPCVRYLGRSPFDLLRVMTAVWG